MFKYLVIIVLLVLCVNNGRGQQFQEQTLLTYTRCRVDTDCLRLSENSFCFDNDDNKIGKCKCLEGYELLSRNKTFFSCLKDAGFGDACTKHIQCQMTLTMNAECDETTKTCRCANHAHRFTDGKCYLSSLLGEYCQVDANCWLKDNTFGSCIRGMCTCKFDKQVPAEDGLSCIDSKRIGEICNNDEECSLVTNAVCNGNCRCGARYILSRDRDRCLRVATAFYEFCEEHGQCSAFLIGSNCLNNSCTCSEGQHGFGSKCVRTAGLGGVCTGTEECIPDMKYATSVNCIDGTCQCQPGVIDQPLGCNSVTGCYRNSETIIVLGIGFVFSVWMYGKFDF